MGLGNVAFNVPVLNLLAGFGVLTGVFFVAVAAAAILGHRSGFFAATEAHQDAKQMIFEAREAAVRRAEDDGRHRGAAEQKKKDVAEYMDRLRAFHPDVSSLEDLYRLGVRHGSEGTCLIWMEAGEKSPVQEKNRKERVVQSVSPG